MFIGHWAPALAAAAVSRRSPSLGAAFIGAQLVDWGFFAFATIGVENMRITDGITAMNPMDLYDMPYTHSLAGTAIWAALFGLVLLYFKRDLVTALIGAGIVLSHWVLDLLVHRPDLTLAGGEHKIGLGLWDYPMIAIPLELGLILGAFFWYLRRTQGPIIPPIFLLGLLLIIQTINWFGPAPTEAGPVLYLSALASFGLVTLAAMWVDRTRNYRLHLGMQG